MNPLRSDPSITDVIAAYESSSSAEEAGRKLFLSRRAVLYRLHAVGYPVSQKTVAQPLPPAREWAITENLGPIVGEATIIGNPSARYVAFRLVERRPVKRVYVAGPMAGITDHNFPAFDAAAEKIAAAGMDPISPANLSRRVCAEAASTSARYRSRRPSE